MHNDRFIIDFSEKAELLNEFFTKQFSLDNDDSKLPSVFTKKYWQSLSTVELFIFDTLKIVRYIDLFANPQE